MSTVTITPANSPRIAHNFNLENDRNCLHDESFSSYLGNLAEIYALEFSESNQNPSCFAGHVKEPLYRRSSQRKYNPNGEISVFNAEKYFSGGMDVDHTAIVANARKPWQSKREGKLDLVQLKTSIESGTSSTCSETSSKGEGTLLPGIEKNPPPSVQKLLSAKRLIRRFSCNCSCYGKKSVGVDEKIEKNCNSAHRDTITDLGEPQNAVIFSREPCKTRGKAEEKKRNQAEDMGDTITGQRAVPEREDSFSFPNLNPVVGNPTVGRQFGEVLENARISVGSFGSPFLAKEKTGSSPSSHAMSNVDGEDEDLQSETSSDLFEIDSLSCKGHPFFNGTVSDDMSNGYEPSEQSIEWSIVTASAVNFSVASDYDQSRPWRKVAESDQMITARTSSTKKSAVVKLKEEKRCQSSLLLGCRSGKALSVATNAYAVYEKPISDHSLPLARFRD